MGIAKEREGYIGEIEERNRKRRGGELRRARRVQNKRERSKAILRQLVEKERRTAATSPVAGVEREASEEKGREV